MSVHSEVLLALDSAGCVGWQRELALALAEKVDCEGQAAAAKELRGLMEVLAPALVVKSDASNKTDELRAQREKRRAEALRAKKAQLP